MKHLTDDEKREWLRQALVNDARQLLQHRPDLIRISDTARGVFTALMSAETWQIAVGPPPADKNWKEPEEIWTVKPKITRRTKDEE